MRPTTPPASRIHVVVVALLCCIVPLAATAAEGSDAAWQRVEDLRSEVRALGPLDASAAGEEADIAFERRLRLERELRGELAGLVERGAGQAAAGPRLGQALSAQAGAIERELALLRKRIDDQRAARDSAAPEAVIDFEYRLRDLHARVSGLLTDLVAVTDQLQALGDGDDVHGDTLDELLRSRAARLSERLELALARIDTVTERGRAAGSEQQAALDLEREALEARRDRLTESLGRVVELMDARGLDTGALKELLFRASGELSGDLLDSGVLLGLAHAWLEDTRQGLLDNGPGWLFKLLVFVAIVLVARYAAHLAARVVRRTVAAPHLAFSQLLQDFFVKLVSGIVLGFGVLIALSQLGIELAPLLAGLGVAGFIVGFALQETLSNFASGLMILVYRPFDVGDVVEAGGVSGTVKHMSLVSTTINTFDNQKLVVPNNRIWGDVIRNVNAEPLRRVDLVFGIGYGDDIAHATRVLEDILAGHELVLDEPAPAVRLHTLGESSIDFLVRPWVRTPDYWTVYWDVTRTVKLRFDAEGISIPFPQRDVHLYRADGA